MNGPKCESDNRGGIKFCKEGGAKLKFDGINWTTKIPHGKKFFKSSSCHLLLLKRIPRVLSLNRNLSIEFGADKNHSNDPIISSGGANCAVWTIIN
jgi:hypothetical protein